MSTADTFSEWLLTTHGQYVLEREQDFIDHSVADVFGFNAMQIGLPQYDLLRASRIPLHILAGAEQKAQVRLNVDELPFACDSLDLVVLPHLLEFSDHPHQILREVERIMLPEGHVIITGFNPRSLWGVRWAPSMIIRGAGNSLRCHVSRIGWPCSDLK
jgi:SAM-dependent methyltransferase